MCRRPRCAAARDLFLLLPTLDQDVPHLFLGGTHLWMRYPPGEVVAPHRGRSSTVLAPAGKQYDVCLFPGRAEEQSPHVPRKTGNVLTAAWPIAINVMVACRPTSGTTSSLPEGIHRHPGPRPRSNAPSQSLPRTEQAPHAVPSPVDLANATCSRPDRSDRRLRTVIVTSYARVFAQINPLLLDLVNSVDHH